MIIFTHASGPAVMQDHVILVVIVARFQCASRIKILHIEHIRPPEIVKIDKFLRPAPNTYQSIAAPYATTVETPHQLQLYPQANKLFSKPTLASASHGVNCS